MTWHSPNSFFLLIPLLLVFLFFAKRPGGAFFYSSLNLFYKKNFSLRASLAFLPQLGKALALVLIVLALARPRSAHITADQTQEGIDIMIVMDISLSMLVEDMEGFTRLQAAKQVVGEFIDGRPYDRMGLIVFSGESFTKVPLTFDHQVLKKSLLQTQTLSKIKEGTAIGVALANATARLKSSPLSSRVIIFLTDGENNTGFIDPGTAIELSRKNKIKVYSIGMGSESGTFPVKYKFQTPDGRSVYRRVYIESHINKKLMNQIASQTGGEFFMAKNLNLLKRIFKKIDELETYEIQINKWTSYKEHFKNPLLAGLLFYFLSVGLSLTVFFRGI